MAVLPKPRAQLHVIAILVLTLLACALHTAPNGLANPPAVEAVLAGRSPVLEALLQHDAPGRRVPSVNTLMCIHPTCMADHAVPYKYSPSARL